MAARVAAVLLAGALLAGCDVRPAPSPAAATPVPFASAPVAVRTRAVLPVCGSEDATPNLPARTCFWNAYTAGLPAEFVTTRPTLEGDPITTIFRSLGQGRGQLFVDASADRFGAQGWIQVDCQGFTLTRDGAFFPDFVPGVAGGPACRETPLGPGS
jgi:hypothetical protein